MRVRLRVWAVFGDPEPGQWCDGCNSHAVTRTPVYLISGYGVASHDPHDHCSTCDPEEVDDDA